ncbi:30S ribosomal protein S2 [bacterium]|nr:MAG: 30S ribosomal protein S2 [bacterium]
MAKSASVEQLLKSGAHFGHLTRRWNPKMKEFIFMQRNGIHILDLKKTEKYLQEAVDAAERFAKSGKKILFVGTKKQAQEIIKQEASRCGMPYVTHRWLGGMLTNFSTVRKSISRLEEIDTMQKDGTFENITKKERLMISREKEKLMKVLAGIANMGRLPGAIFVVDTVKESIAMQEAIKLNIPIIAMVDTNCDPDIPDYIIPSNDDSARTIQLIASNIADAVIEGASARDAQVEEELAAEGDSDSDVEVKESRRRRARRNRKEEVEEVEETEVDASDEDEDDADVDDDASAEDEE